MYSKLSTKTFHFFIFYVIMHLKGGDFMTIADRIKKARIEKGLTQEELAKMCGYSNRTNISRIEHSGDEITTKQVRRIAEKLNVPVTYLMGWQSLYDTVSVFGSDDLTENEKTLVALYRSIPQSEQDHLLDFARFISKEKG